MSARMRLLVAAVLVGLALTPVTHAREWRGHGRDYSVPAAVWAQSAATQAPSRDVPESKAAGNGVEARVEARIKDLRARLRITPAQEPQWDQFAQVMRQNARDMNQAGMDRATDPVDECGAEYEVISAARGNRKACSKPRRQVSDLAPLAPWAPQG